MLIFNDLHDLYAVFVNIRSDPGNPKNADIVNAVSDVLKDRNSKGGCNAFRVALRPLGDLVERNGSLPALLGQIDHHAQGVPSSR